MHTTLTPCCLHDITFFSLKKPRSDPCNLGTSPKVCLWRTSEITTCCSSMGFPSNTSYCVIKPRAWPDARSSPKVIFLRVGRHDTKGIEIRTLYLGTMCFGTIVLDLVSEFGWPGWVTGVPSRYIQSPQPSRPRSLLLRLGPLLYLTPGRSGQSRSSSAVKSLPRHKRDTQPCRMADVIDSRCC